MSEGKSVSSSTSGWYITNGEECDHTDKWKVAPGAYAFVRFCSGCGKSWRMWVKPDFPGEMPVAEWEEIAEPVEQRILPDYEE